MTTCSLEQTHMCVDCAIWLHPNHDLFWSSQDVWLGLERLICTRAKLALLQVLVVHGESRRIYTSNRHSHGGHYYHHN